MAQFKVIVTDYVFEAFDSEREVLAAADADLEVLQCTSAEEVARVLRGERPKSLVNPDVLGEE